MTYDSASNDKLLKEIERLKLENQSLQDKYNLDISRLKQSEKILKESEERYRSLFEKASEGIFYLSLEQKIVRVNESFALMHGYTVAEMEEMNLQDLDTPGTSEKIPERLAIVLSGETLKFEVEHFHKEGHTIQLEVTSSLFSIGGEKIILALHRDISEHKRTEQKIREINEHMKTIFDTLSEGVALNEMVFNDFGEMIDYKILEVNNAFYKIADFLKTNNVIGSFATELYGFDQNFVKDFWKTHKSNNDTVQAQLISPISQRIFSVSTSPFSKNRFVTSFHDITERKQAEAALEESREKYRGLSEASFEAVFISEKGRCIEQNQTAEKMFGYSSEEAIGRFGTDWIFAEDREMVMKNILAGVEEPYEARALRKDGSTFPCLFRGKMMYYKGKTVRVTALTDITERKMSEVALRESEERFRALIEGAPDAIFLADPETGIIVDCNKAASRLLAKEYEQIIGMSQHQLHRLQSNTTSDELFKAYIREANLTKPLEHVILRSDGTKIPVEILGGLIQIQDKSILMGTFRDLTERKQNEKKISLLANALKSVSESVSITDLENNLLFANQSFLKTYGFEEEEIIGKNIIEICSPKNPSDLVNTIVPATIKGEWQGELINRRKDKTEFPIFLSTNTIRDADNNPVAFIGVTLDITERKRREQELIKAKELAEQSDKLKDAFIAGISHEIRTPLNGILGMTSIIREVYAPYIREEEEKYFVAVDKSCQRIIRTIDLILNYSRLHAGAFTIKRDMIDLSTVCESLIMQFEPLATKKSLSLSFKNKIAKSLFSLDKYSINQSISILLDNAIKFTPKGFVEIVLETGNNDEIVLSIKDSGIGISDEYLLHIFEPYSQEQVGYGREFEGVGLGLAIAKRILDLNNVGISVKSKKGEGTTFFLTFGKELKSSQNIFITQVNFATDAPDEKERTPLVLIVEDDKVNQEILTLFARKKYNYILTDSSDKVFEILRNNKIDLILMDISIKGSRNGLEVTKELKATREFAHIPVMAVTAHVFEKDRDNSFAAGCEDYLPKPFTKKDLLDKMGKLIKPALL